MPRPFTCSIRYAKWSDGFGFLRTMPPIVVGRLCQTPLIEDRRLAQTPYNSDQNKRLDPFDKNPGQTSRRGRFVGHLCQTPFGLGSAFDTNALQFRSNQKARRLTQSALQFRTERKLRDQPMQASEPSIYICDRDGARVHAYAARGAVMGAEEFFVRRFIASCNSSISKGFARNMSTFNSS